MTLRPFFFPKHVALIGASREPHKVGYALAQHLRHFSGRVSYVNKKGYRLLEKKCVPSVLQIVGSVDLAVIATPAVTVPSVLIECAQKKIKHIVLLSAGFSETGDDALSTEVKTLISRYKFRVLGPNCFGLVNTQNNLDLTFALMSPLPGSIAFVAQSGALWSAIVERSVAQGFGFSSYLSLGNMLDINFLDAMRYYARDSRTKVVVCYLETLRTSGRAFMRLVSSLKKPVIVLKGGRSHAGARASLSHTGSLAGESAVYDAALRQCGAYVTSTISETFDLAQFLAWQPRLCGKRVVVVTNAGGPGIICVDLLEKYGLHVVSLPQDFSLPRLRTWSQNNPIDLVGDAGPERFSYAFSCLAKQKFYDAILVLYTPQQMGNAEGVARAVLAFSRKVHVPILTCFMGEHSVVGARDLLLKEKIPCFFEMERAIRVLADVQPRLGQDFRNNSAAHF